jgi:hypothetical protein
VRLAYLYPEVNYSTTYIPQSCKDFVTGTVNKYVDPALFADYEKDYKKKHGIDFAKFMAEHQHDRTPPPTHDEQLWRAAVVAHIKDKAGFVEAVATLSKDPVWPPLGELDRLFVQGDTATGHAKETLVPRPGEPPPKPGKSPLVIDTTVGFRRVNGGWLIDSVPSP